MRTVGRAKIFVLLENRRQVKVSKRILLQGQTLMTNELAVIKGQGDHAFTVRRAWLSASGQDVGLYQLFL